MMRYLKDRDKTYYSELIEHFGGDFVLPEEMITIYLATLEHEGFLDCKLGPAVDSEGRRISERYVRTTPKVRESLKYLESCFVDKKRIDMEVESVFTQHDLYEFIRKIVDAWRAL